MKRWLMIALLISSVVSGGQCLAANLLANPGFESGGIWWWTFARGSTVSADWTIENLADTYCSTLEEAAVTEQWKTTYGFNDVPNIHSGSKACRCSGWKSYNGITSRMRLYQDVAANPTLTYGASAWVCRVSRIPGAGFGYHSEDEASLQIQFLGSGGAVISSQAMKSVTTPGGWVQLSDAFTPPAGTVAIRFNLYSTLAFDYSQGSAVWDDAVLEVTGSATQPISIAQARSSSDGAGVYLEGKVVSAQYRGFYYIQEPDRTSGIRVQGAATPGHVVAIEGVVGTVDGEKAIIDATLVSDQTGAAPQPIGVRVKPDGGLNPDGLYIKTWGKVTGFDSNAFIINNGSGPMRVRRSPTYPGFVGDYVSVVGVMGSEMSGGQPTRILRAAKTVGHRFDSDWLQYRGDRCLTGRCWSTGDIATPALKWSRFIGARESLLSFSTESGNPGTQQLPTSDYSPEAFSSLYAEWGYTGPFLDLDGTGTLSYVGYNPNYKVGKMIPTLAGLQKVEFDSGFTTGGNPSIPLYGRMYSRSGGQWSLSWTSDAIPHMYVAQPIFGDFDDDGEMEVACTPFYNIWILNAATGVTEHIVPFVPSGTESGRSYGWFGAFDLDADGRMEFVALSNAENYVSVIGWDGNQPVKLWDRLIERGVSAVQTQQRAPTNAVQDVDGDGLLEIVTSFYNATGDGCWHAQVINGTTGEVKLDLAEQIVMGLEDLDNDGAVDLLCAQTTGQLLSESALLTAFSFNGGLISNLWQETDSSYQMQSIVDFPANVNSSATIGRTTLLAGPTAAGGRPVFFTRHVEDMAAGLIRVTMWQMNQEGQIVAAGSAVAPNLEALAVRIDSAGGPTVLMRAQSTGDVPAEIEYSGAVPQVAASRRNSGSWGPAVVARLSTGPKTVVVEAACERVLAFQPNGSSTTLKWSRPGRGLYWGGSLSGEGWYWGGVVAADLEGNGTPCIIVGTRSPAGQARIQALRPDGSEYWSHDFADMPGAPPIWNTSGLTMWFAGRFRDASRDDVLVNIRRTNYAECILLDGLTGAEIWRRTEGGHVQGVARSAGGYWTAIFDYDGDGLDEAYCCYPDVAIVMDGADGSLLLDKYTGDTFGFQVIAYTPVVGDLLQMGGAQVLAAGNQWLTGLTDLDGVSIWNTGMQTNTPLCVPQCFGDVDGDGKVDVLSPGHRPAPGSSQQEFRCYDAATGSLKWSFPMDGYSVSAPACCDVNGDGRVECLFGSGATLYCVGASIDGLSGRVLWTMDLPGYIGAPSIADVDGSGRPQIVLTCSDGYVYGIGSP